jgi:hypothetical protein
VQRTTLYQTATALAVRTREAGSLALPAA